MTARQEKTHRPEGLKVWHEALELAVECYRLSDRLPRKERFGLCSQLERASTSVVANIAEGHGRAAPRQFLYFMAIARGSLREIETYFALFERLGYFLPAELDTAKALAERVGKMLLGLRRSVLQKAGTHGANGPQASE